MGFYLRKSIKVGSVRFNLSKSGVGVSSGVRGLRLGTGPRGNYVHMGRGGLYYRATLPGQSVHPRPVAPRNAPRVVPDTHEPLRDIESADVAQIVDSSSAELLRELNEKRKRKRLRPLVVVGTSALFLVGAMNSWPAWVLTALVGLGVIGALFAHKRDVLAKTSVLFYELDEDMESSYGLLITAVKELASCSKAWHIEAQGQVRDRKYHAGATNLVRRKPTFIRKAEPPYLKTNLETFAVGAGRQVLYFLPDRVLVYDRGGIGAVSYSHLEASATVTQFIETDGVSRDAKVVDHTWKYVNKRGGPDRRFKDNPQLPICLYDEISLRSVSGLNEVIQVSRCNVAQEFVRAIGELASTIPVEESPSAV